MKNLPIFLLLLLSAIALSTQSCTEEDPCEAVTCGTNGSCNEGDCICETGYEKDAQGQCNVAVNAKFIGDYRTSELCSTNGNTNNDSYNTSIAAGTANDPFSLSLQGIYFNFTLSATVEADGNTFMIPTQTVQGYTISDGIGTLNADTGVITITFTPSINGASESCTATLTLQ